MISIKLTI